MVLLLMLLLPQWLYQKQSLFQTNKFKCQHYKRPPLRSFAAHSDTQRRHPLYRILLRNRPRSIHLILIQDCGIQMKVPPCNKAKRGPRYNTTCDFATIYVLYNVLLRLRRRKVSGLITAAYFIIPPCSSTIH